MNKLIIKKTLGYKDPIQTFVINTKPYDTNREVEVQIADEISLVDFVNVYTANLCCLNIDDTYENCIDLSSTINKTNSSVTFSLSNFSIGENLCEIILKDNDDKIILITNTFMIKVRKLGGDCN